MLSMVFPESEITSQFRNRLKELSIFIAAAPCFIGALVLLGWQFDIEFLKRIIPGLVAMNPATAICFVFLGASVILINKYGTSKNITYAWHLLVLLTLVTGLSCLIMNLSGIEGGIDHLFFTEKLKDEVSNIRNRMAPNTAFNFIISSIALVLLSRGQSKHKTAHYLILVTSLIALLSVIGYIYGVRSFYGVLTYIPMAIHTSFCFILISCSVLLLTCDKGLMAGFTNNFVGSVLARRLLPAIITVPVLLGFIIIYGEKAGLYVTHFGTALFTAANILIFVYLVKKIQASVNKADEARTEAENKLIELNAKLEEKSATLEMLNGELESFSYSISHDLKAPLRAMNGYARILQEDYKDKLGEEGSQTAEAVVKNAKKMGQLIDDLLEFSRIRRQELRSSYCDMEQLVKIVLQEQYIHLKKKEYEIKIQQLSSCSGDPKMIQQVWVNLISNALKYSEKKEKPVIEIGSYTENNETIYFVKDNGAGFDMSYAGKLFAAFQRLHTDRDFEGTGIGLAIVHRIVTRHGGKVWAEAKTNEGAKFYFSLPSPAGQL